MNNELTEEELAVFDFRHDQLEQLKQENQQYRNERQEMIGVLNAIDDVIREQLKKLTK